MQIKEMAYYIDFKKKKMKINKKWPSQILMTSHYTGSSIYYMMLKSVNLLLKPRPYPFKLEAFL